MATEYRNSIAVTTSRRISMTAKLPWQYYSIAFNDKKLLQKRHNAFSGHKHHHVNMTMHISDLDINLITSQRIFKTNNDNIRVRFITVITVTAARGISRQIKLFLIFQHLGPILCLKCFADPYLVILC